MNSLSSIIFICSNQSSLPRSFISMTLSFSKLQYAPSLLFILLSVLPSVNSISFQISRFNPDATNMIYEGDAKTLVGDIEFNGVDFLFQVGRATYAERVRVWDSETKKLTHFKTRFSFVIDTFGRPIYAAGFAFFLAPVGYPIPPNSGGGFLGLFNTTTSFSTQNQIVLVEFDTFSNGWDPPVQHVGINKNSISSAVYTPWNASSHTGDTADATISYNGTTKNLSVSWTYSNNSNPRENSSLAYQIDLREVLPEWVTIGFSAATSHYVESHRLRSWEFWSSLEDKETNGENAEQVRLVVSLSVSVAVVAAGVTVAVWIVIRRRRWKNKETARAINLTSMNDDLERGAGPRRFSYTDLVSATHNFSAERKLGEGGFGAVYKGYLIDIDVAVAVKKISRGSRQGKKEYVTEVKIISQLRHRNLVQLIGWCHDGGEFLLVYEFMPNGSLDSHLFGKKTPLAWAVRYRIALGLASALLYLHEEWEQCVVHRDIKSSNIMLDSSFSVKLGDFGLARLMDHELGPQTTGLAGTLGYMAPEYINTGRASKESDVFSFGVVALEIATGRKSVDPIEEEPEMGLVEWVWDLYGRGKLVEAADERMNSDFDENQIECLMTVGLWCANPDHTSRPSIRQALQLLNFETAKPNLPAKMPVPIYHVPTPSIKFGESIISYSTTEVSH